MERKQSIAVVWTWRKNEATHIVKITNSPGTDWKVLWGEINNTRRNYIKRQGGEFEERRMMQQTITYYRKREGINIGKLNKE
jgi:hypothetical protein